MSANTLPEHGLLTEVPEPLKRLTRIIIRGFYGIEAALVVDLLVRNACMKEEDMVELLKFDRKHLRSIMNTLKSDKFIKVRICVETDAESKTTRHNIYFINYTMFVNVVKYKLDHMRRKIESDERDSTNRASFKCPRCGKTFTDLEVNELFDPMTGVFRCTYCQMEVEEDGSSVPKEDSRTLLVRFNDQIQPIYSLLKECEDFKLAPEVLEPELTDLKTITGRDKSSKHKSMPGERTAWSGDQTKNRDFNYKESTVTISMDETDKGAGLESVPQKERPVWMVESTIEGIVEEPDITQNSSVIIDAAPNASAPVVVRNNEDIMRTLIVHEKKSAAAIGARPGSEDSSSSESEEDARVKVTQRATDDVEEMMDDDDDDEDAVTMVTIGDTKVSYHDVTEDMVATMTQSEKEAYIRLGQEMYKHMYE